MTAATRTHAILFTAGGQSYALPLGEVEQVLPMAELSRTPAGPPWLSGFLNLAGQGVAVVCLSRLFGLSPSEAELYTPVLIVRASGDRLGLWIDRVSRIISLEQDEVMAVAQGCSVNDCALGIVSHEGQSAVLLSVERLLLHRERQAVDDLRALQQRRIGELETVAR